MRCAAVETGAAETVLILGGDATGLAGYAKVAANYNTATQKHLSPLGHGGPNGVYALVASRQIKKYGLEKSDYGHIAVAQRQWAAKNPYAVYRTPLTMEEYLAAPLVADPLSRYDCVPVVAGAQAIIVARPDRAPKGRPGVRVRAHRAQLTTTTTRRATGCRPASARSPRSCGRRPACGRTTSTSPAIYDDYPTMVLAQANDLGLIPGNDLARFCRVTIGEKRFPVNTWGGMLSRRPARRPRRRLERHFRSGAAIAAPRRRAAGEGRAARGHHRLRHDDVPLRRHRRGGDPGARGMSAGVTIWRCANCRAGYFPEPLLCPRCHGGKFETDRVHEAVVEEVSVIRHMIGQENWQPRRIANVLHLRRPAHDRGPARRIRPRRHHRIVRGGHRAVRPGERRKSAPSSSVRRLHRPRAGACRPAPWGCRRTDRRSRGPASGRPWPARGFATLSGRLSASAGMTSLLGCRR